MNNQTIGIIGAGVMGSIFVERLSGSHVLINDLDEDKLSKVENDATVMLNQKELVEESDVLILAVKPQDFKELASNLKGLISKDKLVISIMAGVSIETVQTLIGVDSVVRAMPNIPSKIGKGVVVWKSTGSSGFDVGAILGRLGKVIEVENEEYIDMATAVSGSGPAYVYLFQEMLIEAAKSIGLPGHIAEELVVETILGSLELQQDSNASPAVLREQVTSKGGTTEAAIKVFEENHLAKIFQSALKRAYERSQELKRND